jgi:crotonobetainyl-CoA:carnitine CoA-transferase CaiB-like acyl-CoA transferase
MPPPELGEHNAQVLRELGYSEAEIERLAEQGAFG